MVPSFDGGDNLVRVSGPGEWFWVFVGFDDEAIDCGLEIYERVEDAPFKPSPCEFGEEPFNGVEPGGGCWREMEYEPFVAVEPSPDLRVLMGGVVIEDDMNGFVGWNLGVDHVHFVQLHRRHHGT